jgi:hypothetical protein
MAPWRYDECPVCRRRTRQWIGGLEDGPNGNGCVGLVCEDCMTVLLVAESGVIGQRVANDRERALYQRRNAGGAGAR